VIGMGYSNGANILASVQFADGALFDTTVLLHPLIPFEPQPQPKLKGKSVLITAGELDPICPPHLTKALHAWYEQQGAAVEMLWHSGGHDIRQPEILAASRFVLP
jgi:phospholipase/carboxylesterase